MKAGPRRKQPRNQGKENKIGDSIRSCIPNGLQPLPLILDTISADIDTAINECRMLLEGKSTIVPW
jgi:hypothetical protein